MPDLLYSLQTEYRLRYLLVAPTASASAHQPRPVLCFLHGYDEGPPTGIEDGLTRHGPLRSGNNVPALTEFIVIAPQMPARGDLWYRYADDVQQIVATVQKRCGGDAQRLYLTGFSYGGNGVFDVALRQPRRWAALWAVDPTRIPTRDPGRPVWLSIGAVARQRQKEFAAALGLKRCAPADCSDRVVMDQGADHVNSAKLAYRDERIYTWMLSKRIRASV